MKFCVFLVCFILGFQNDFVHQNCSAGMMNAKGGVPLPPLAFEKVVKIVSRTGAFGGRPGSRSGWNTVTTHHASFSEHSLKKECLV